MDPNRYLFMRTEPWASIGWWRRIARVCRILFGCTLFVAFVALSGMMFREIFVSSSWRQILTCIVGIPLLFSLAWAVGCMYIWRGVYPASNPASNGPPPPAPPSEGAPRPAPLRPFSPLILSAHAELPDTRNT